MRRHALSLRKSRHTGRELSTLAVIVAGVTLPFVAVTAIQSLTMQPDLYDLVVRSDNQSPNPPIIGWSGLAGRVCDCRTRILGYMMDNQRPIPDGTSVSNFVLLSDAGTLLHPAHRIPEEMIDIRLRAGAVTQFKSRQLVWAEGTMTSCYTSSRGTEPLYCLTDAAVLGAESSDINRFFRSP